MIFFFVILACVIAYVVFAKVKRGYYPLSSEIRIAFRELASKLELAYYNGSLYDPPRVSGEIAGQKVTLAYRRIKGKTFVVLEVAPQDKVYYNIVLEKKTDDPFLSIFDSGTTGKTGDDLFDASISLPGNNPPYEAAILDFDTRVAVSSSAARTEAFRIQNSGITAIYDAEYFVENHNASILEQAASLGRRLSSPVYTKECLIRNALNDPDDKVKSNNLKNLSSYTELDEKARECFEKAVLSKSVDVVSAAVQGLGKSYVKRLYPFLNGEPGEQIIAINVIASFGKPVKASTFIRIFTRAHDYNVRIAILDLFGKTGQKDVEGFLIEALELSSIEVKIRAIKALASCGGISAVEPLYKIAHSYGPEPAVKHEAESAIRAIQERFGATERGAVSLEPGDAETGSLSLDESEDDGSVSLLKDESDKE